MFKIELEIQPKEALQDADVRATLRNIVAGRMRRAMEKVAAAAASGTPWARIAAGYKVVQASEGDTISFEIVNTNPVWPFTEWSTRPHFPPWGEGTPLARWANERGIPPFLVARKISKTGTLGKHILGEAWDEGANTIADAADGAIDAWLERWGVISA